MLILCKCLLHVKKKKLPLLILFVARKTSLPRSTKTLTVLGFEKETKKFIPQQQIPVVNHYFHFFPNKCGIALVSHRKRTCKRQLLNIVYMKNVQNMVTLTHQHWGIYVIPNIYSISYWGCHKMIVLLSCVMFWYRFFTRLCFMVLGSSLKGRSRSLLQ